MQTPYSCPYTPAEGRVIYRRLCVKETIRALRRDGGFRFRGHLQDFVKAWTEYRLAQAEVKAEAGES